jgi:hypothetical protein
MFGWFRTLVSRRASSRRDIFVFTDGLKQRRIDPWDAWVRIWTDAECDFATQMPLCAKGDPDAARAIEAMVRRVFSVGQFDPDAGTGLTILEQHDLLSRFTGYVQNLKKKLGISPTPSPPTESRSSVTPESSTMKPDSPSSSTASESTSVAPT